MPGCRRFASRREISRSMVSGITVPELLQLRDHGRKIHFALPDGHLSPSFFGSVGYKPSFACTPWTYGPSTSSGVHRIGLAVHDEIGDVEVHAEVVHTHVADRAEQRDRRFLAGLAAEILAVRPSGFSSPKSSVWMVRPMTT